MRFDLSVWLWKLFFVCIYVCSAVMLSHRGQNGTGAKILASASKIWPRPRSLASASNIWPWPGLDLVFILCNWAFLGKNRVKFGNFVNFSGNNLKSYVVNSLFGTFS